MGHDGVEAMMRTRAIRCLIWLFVGLTPAVLATDEPFGVYKLSVSDSQAGPGARPILMVSFYSPIPTTLGGGQSFALEWTANGQPQSASLKDRATCVEGAAQQYWCTALQNWLGDPPRYGRRAVADDQFPQAFYLPGLEFDTQYCIRVRAGHANLSGSNTNASWSEWRCARTAMAPPIPPAPMLPQVTLLPASSGHGSIGAGEPARMLVEWLRAEESIEESTVAYYEVQRSDRFGRNWTRKQTLAVGTLHSQTAEAAIPFSVADELGPDRQYLFRVCAGNVSGLSCSPAGRPDAFVEMKHGSSDQHPDLHGAAQEFGSPPSPNGVRLGGGVKLPPGSAEPSRPICELAQEARARNSPAARGLEEQCRAALSAQVPSAELDALAAKGPTIADQDPLAVELRNQQSEGAVRRGFDIGMAAAEGQTEPGPGKQRVHDALGADERAGFSTALEFSLQRNRNAALAASGAAIASADPIVAEARTADPDVLYWLGFDIATGIFGDPALGARGNTAIGPGSLGIRDALSAAGQRGFNAAVSLHLGRNYRP